MKDTLRYILEHIVSHPESIDIQQNDQDQRIILTVKVHEEDMGAVIGKHGRIIRGVRDMVKLIAAKQNVFADVVLDQ